MADLVGRRFRHLLMPACALALTVSVACGSSTVTPGTSGAPATGGAATTPSAAAAPLGGALTYRLPGDWNSLDPFVMATTGASQILGATYDRLVAFDQGGKVVPYLATSWQQTPTSITFKLRTDATCPDGSKITPSLVVDNWKRQLDPAKPSPWAAQLLGKGPYTFTPDEASASVTFAVTQQRGDELYAFGRENFGAIICPAGLKDPTSLNTNIFGSGPYSLVSAAQGDNVRLKVRPDWKWGPKGTTATTGGFPQELVLKVVTNETTAANLILTGGTDVSIVKGPDVVRLRADKSLTSQKAFPFTTDLMQFNHDPARPTSDLVLRKALATAVDPAEWDKAATNGEGVASTSLMTPQAPCFDPETSKLMPKPSVDNARAMLKAGGYVEDAGGKMSKNGKPVSIKVLGYSFHGSAPEYLASRFTQLGLTTTLEVLDTSQTQLKYRAGDWDVVVGNWSFPVPGPLQIFAYMIGPNPPTGVNFSRIDDPEMERAVAAAKATTGDEQCRNWATAQERFLDQMHGLPVPGQVTNIFARTGFGFTATSNNVVEIYTLRAPPK